MSSPAKSQNSELVMDALDQYERPLTRYAMRVLGGDLAMARDVVQHAFLKLCEKSSGLTNDRLAPWLYTVCRNRAIDVMRGRKSEEQLGDHGHLDNIWHGQNGRHHAAGPGERVADAEFFEKLQSLIDDLPESQKEVVELWSQGFSSNEMSRITGKTAGAVRIALHRALQNLRKNESVQRWLGETGEGNEPASSPLSERYRELR